MAPFPRRVSVPVDVGGEAEVLTRRYFLERSLSALPMGVLAFDQFTTNGAGHLNGTRELKAVKEFKDAYLRSLSTDGKKLCIYFTRHPNTIFTLRSHGKGRIDTGNPKEERIAVILTGSWETAYTGSLARPPAVADFISGSSGLYVELVGLPGDHNVNRMTVDLSTGHREPGAPVRQQDGFATGYRALDDSALLGIETSDSPYRHNALTRALLPNYEEVARASFAEPVGEEPDGYETFPYISADRSSFIYAFGHRIVCRRARDLQVLWTTELDERFFGARTLAISANGGTAAVAVVDTTVWDRQRNYYVAVYSGRDGTLVRKIDINGDQGVAVSPDGGSVAVARRLREQGVIHLVVEIYDIGFGRLLSSGTHDRVSSGRYQNLNGVFDYENGLQFTSDGRYLITSGNNRVKIWEI